MEQIPKNILVTGANGQLARCIKDATVNYRFHQFSFMTKEELDISNLNFLEEYFSINKFDYCINTAAYTQVEKAESEPEKAFAINAEAVKNLAQVCKKNDVVLLHISTDYVFDGKKTTPYLETDATNPINIYGASKLKGEEYIKEICDKFFIFRTSWLYSQYGNNFLKTVLNYAEEGKPLTITTEQTGAPTNANDLAQVLLKLIEQDSSNYGVYHFSNSGATTWYGFAKEILRQTDKLDTTTLAKTDHYPTFAARPMYSGLDCEKSVKILDVELVSWQKSLSGIINRM